MLKLSPRQREVATAVGRDGLSWAAVAQRLGISHHTAITHAENARRRAAINAKRLRAAMVEVYWCHLHDGRG